MHKDGGILNCDAVQAGPTVSPNRLATEVGAEAGDNVGFVVGEVGAGVGVVVGTEVGTGVGAVEDAVVCAVVVGAGMVIIPEIALLVGLASVRAYCSGEVHAAIAAHTVSDVVVAEGGMNSCSVHRVVVLHTLADGVML